MSGLRTREPGVGSSVKAHPPSAERERFIYAGLSVSWPANSVTSRAVLTAI
jgi:hypothetical protein